MYLKRNKIEKFWPVPRKGTKYIAVPSHNHKQSIPLLVVMRDVLGIVKTKKELKKAINEKQILINHKIVRETNFPICLFDKLSLPKLKKHFRMTLSENKKMTFEEISEKEAERKTFKVIGKKILSGNKQQLNLMHGKNLLTDEKTNIGDSVVFDFKHNKIVKTLPLEKGQNILVIRGLHAGISGKIEELMTRGDKQLAKIVSKKEKINVWTKNILAVE
jgi:small subunit ribosomal protein S4e